MKQILTIVMLLTGLASYSQDTTGVMITLDELIYLDYSDGLAVTREFKRGMYETHAFEVGENEVLALHLYDDTLGAYRGITTTWLNDGDHRHDEFHSDDNIIYSPFGWGPMVIEVSGPIFK